MKYETMLPVAAVLSLALGAGCERRDDTGTTRTTSATPSQMDDMVRDAAGGTMGTTGTAGATGMNDTAGATGTTATTGATTGGKVEQPLAEHDKDFLIIAASGNMAAVALGTTASQKATTPEVKSFADRMVTDHGKAEDELKSLAAKKGVTLPSEMDRSPKNEQEKLSKLTGKKFDKEYTEVMVKDHERDVKEFQKAAKEAKDPDVKVWAIKMVPILEDHLKAAKQLEPKVK